MNFVVAIGFVADGFLIFFVFLFLASCFFFLSCSLALLSPLQLASTVQVFVRLSNAPRAYHAEQDPIACLCPAATMAFVNLPIVTTK